MRISDWSSDVCSSDLCARRRSVPMQSRILALAVAGILSVPPLAVAEGAAATDLDEVVVTATRTEVALADSLFPVQVIDHDEIVRSQARSLTEIGRASCRERVWQ